MSRQGASPAVRLRAEFTGRLAPFRYGILNCVDLKAVRYTSRPIALFPLLHQECL